MKYFTFAELTASAAATARGIDNAPGPEIREKLTFLTERLLDPVRERWNAPITVNSGYRCPALNKAIGGAPTSQHIRGEAADITVGSPEENRRLFDLILSGGFSFDQLIDEKNYRWIHVSYSRNNRNQILHL